MRFVRAGVLLVIGFVIAFSATLHEQAAFDRWLVVAALIVLGLAWACEAAASRTNPALARTAVLQFGVTFAAGLLLAVLPFADQTLATALVVAAWAILVALLQLTTVLRATQAPAAGIPAVLLSALLAVLVFLSRDDAVAVIGFFGGTPSSAACSSASRHSTRAGPQQTEHPRTPSRKDPQHDPARILLAAARRSVAP
ncbi:hypothetical protein AB3K78_14270 [Leucobacter sp. HNU]|uniref:hypothetical protein n=1 Tax=Leucobacter sp. HNU TaxID=3236805 RepID=UPI003A8045C7